MGLAHHGCSESARRVFTLATRVSQQPTPVFTLTAIHRGVDGDSPPWRLRVSLDRFLFWPSSESTTYTGFHFDSYLSGSLLKDGDLPTVAAQVGLDRFPPWPP